MDIHKLTMFFMWCTVINGALLILGITVCMLGPEFIYSMQGKLFHLPRETLSAVIYLSLGLFKIAWLVFNAVPYLALLIIGRK